MKHSLFILCGILSLFIISCSGDNDNKSDTKLTFKDVETFLNTGKPLSEISKKNILEKYGTIENYYEVVKKQKEYLSNKNRSNDTKRATKLFTIRLTEIGYYNTLYSGRDDMPILDTAQEVGIDIDCSDRAGSTSDCVSKLLGGKIDQSDQNFLTDADMEKNGWVLVCAAYPLSDCALQTNLEYFYNRIE